MQVESTIKTVSKQEAIQFLQNSNGLIDSKSKTTNAPLVYEFEKITQEKTSHKEALITVIPVRSAIKGKKTRVILWKVDNTIETIIYNEYASESSTITSFTGIIIMTRLNGDFVRAYKLKNNDYVIDLVPIKKDATSKSSNSFDENPNGLQEVIVINDYKKTSYTFVPMIDGSNKSVSDLEDYYWLKSGGGGGAAAEAEPVVEEMPPSCESFNFVKTAGLWQVALVKNVHFKVFLLNEKGVEILHWVDFPQPISFGTPTNIQMGNTDITPGLAANASARALQKTMQDVIDKYGSSRTSDSTLMLYFQERLKYNYPLYIPGGRVNFNATENIVATEYKTNPWTAGNCN